MGKVGLPSLSLVAAVLALVVALPAQAAQAAQAGQAQAGQAQAQDTDGWEEMLDIFESLFDMADSRQQLTPQQITEFVNRLTNAVAGVKDEVLGHLTQQILEDFRGEVSYATTYTGFLNISSLRGPYINRVAGAFTQAETYITSLDAVRNNDTALNGVGAAMITLAQILEGSFVAIGNPGLNDAHLPVFRRGLETLIREMDPTSRCQYVPSRVGVDYRCVFGGLDITAVQESTSYRVLGSPHVSPTQTFAGAIDTAFIQELIMRDTIRPTAQAVRDLLIQRGVPVAPPLI